MDKVVLKDKTKIPTEIELKNLLGNSFSHWKTIQDFTFMKYPEAITEWNYPGDKYGWNFCMKDKKRVIVYFLPREKSFKLAFVCGRKATDSILSSKISPKIKQELETAKVHEEGRGIWIDIIDETLLADIKELININKAE
jgi:hypothetical protein